MTKKPLKSADELITLTRLFCRNQKKITALPTKAELLKAYHKLRAKNKIPRQLALEGLLTKRHVRTLSGVAIITVLTKPFPCPGKCVYCPLEIDMPKSYLKDEPAAARAFKLKFDPYEQVARRLKTLTENGHPTDKVELIVKGGTWNAYPPAYQYWFILRCFEAANTSHKSSPPYGGGARGGVNIIKLKKNLLTAQNKNETGKHRIIGLTLETRPDFVNEATIKIMRELGCTRVELGAQSTDDKILKLIKRGHDTTEIKRATALLKNYGFKVDYHLMPQLPGTTPAKDLKMMLKVFSDPDYRPDMIKIYPCVVMKKTELYRWFKKGQYRPYADKKLIELLINFKTRVPRYVRLSRIIRDIPGGHIMAGNKVTNLRQIIAAEMAKRGLRCNCLRCREVGHRPEITNHKSQITNKNLKLFIEKYRASGGMEYFLSIEDPKRRVVFAFCRLRLNNVTMKQYNNVAYIRELHTYGQLLNIGQKNKTASQHRGWGKKLMAEAEKICRKNKISELAVISGVGVRDYYRHLGYRLKGGYMVKKIKI